RLALIEPPTLRYPSNSLKRLSHPSAQLSLGVFLDLARDLFADLQLSKKPAQRLLATTYNAPQANARYPTDHSDSANEELCPLLEVMTSLPRKVLTSPHPKCQLLVDVLELHGDHQTCMLQIILRTSSFNTMSYSWNRDSSNKSKNGTNCLQPTGSVLAF